MKKTFKFFAAALAIVAAASCAKEPISNENSENNDQVLVHKVFSASLDSDESPESKTTLHTDGKTVHWTAGDQIKLIPAGGYKGDSFSIIESSINGTFADFEGETVDATSYRAVYPAGAYYDNVSYSDQFVFNADAMTPQYAVANNFSKNAYGCTNLSVSTTAKDGHLYFQNICAYLKLKVAADNVYSIEVTSSKVTSYNNGGLESRGLGGSINYRPSAGLTYMSSNNNAIVFKNENEAVLSTGVDYYIAIPAVQIEGLKLTLKDESGNVVNSLTKSSFTATSNTIYNLGSIEAAPKKYTVSKQISNATELVSGNKYVIQSYGSQSKFWTNVDNKLVLTGDLSISSEFSEENIFEYTEEGLAGITASDSYNHKSCGCWKSVANEKYVGSNFAINAGLYTGLVVVSANGWDGESGKDIDMYKNGSDQTLCVDSGYSNFNLATIANSGGNPYRKWYIYEVQEVE